MVFICYNCLYKINHNIIKAHDKSFCGTICRNKYFTNNNYDINNIDKFMENKYYNTTTNSLKPNSKNYQYYLNTNNSNNSNNIDNFITYIHDNNIKNLNTDSYTSSNNRDCENHNNMINHNYDLSYDSLYYSLYDSFYDSLYDSGNKIKKGFFRTCNLFNTFISYI